MKYMLDTNTCIFIIKKRGNVINNLTKHGRDEACISSITYAELIYGVKKSKAQKRNLLVLKKFLSEMDILDFDIKAAEQYGVIRTELGKAGTPIGTMDMLIAAHAKAVNAVAVTNNIREFGRVEGLKVEDWL